MDVATELETHQISDLVEVSDGHAIIRCNYRRHSEVLPKEVALPLAEGEVRKRKIDERVEEILDGAKGPRRDAVVLNAAFAAMAAGRAENAEEGVALAAESIDSGRAQTKLEALKSTSHELGAEPPAEE